MMHMPLLVRRLSCVPRRRAFTRTGDGALVSCLPGGETLGSLTLEKRDTVEKPSHIGELSGRHHGG